MANMQKQVDKSALDVKDIYTRLVALETKVDLLNSTKMETLRELRIGTIVLIILTVLNLLIHLYFFLYKNG